MMTLGIGLEVLTETKRMNGSGQMEANGSLQSGPPYNLLDTKIMIASRFIITTMPKMVGMMKNVTKNMDSFAAGGNVKVL